MLTRRMILTAAVAAPAAALFTHPAMAAEPAVYSDSGIAIRGADPVAFFAVGEPVFGNAENALMWNGTTWHFASAENMELFMANPEAYAPQYGGYFAFAMASGYLASSVPDAWTIHEDKLYLNFSTGVRRR
jgi:YHS domain-containing protein